MLEYIDIPNIHCFKDENAKNLMLALADTVNLDVFD